MKHQLFFARLLPLVPLVAVGWLPCQSAADGSAAAPLPHTSLALPVPIHSQAADEGVGYGIWAAGSDYKVGFAGGMQFVPYLGRERAESLPLAWRTQSVTIGEVQLCTSATPRLECSPWRAEYDLGGVVEAYDVRAAGLEQTFVLTRAPGVAGDLVIRGVVTTSLQPLVGRNAIDFVDADGLPIVRYGEAVAIDAHGQRLPMQTAITAEGLELRLDAALLAGARFPLVVDPLLTPVATTSGLQIQEVAIAHDPQGASGNVWQAEVRFASATDSDVRLYRTDDNGQNPTLVFSDLSVLWASADVSLGINRPSSRTLLAFTRYFNGNDTKRVRMHVHERTDFGLATTVFNMTDTGGRNQWRPVVGSDLSPVSFTSLLVAFQVESTGAFANSTTSAIYGAEVALGGTGSVVSQFAIADLAVVDSERPALAQVAVGPARVWTVAYQQYVNFTVPPNVNDWNIVLRRVDQTGATGTPFVVDGSFIDEHQMAPRLAGADDRLMLFYTDSTIAESSNKPLTPNGHRIRGVRLNWTPAGFVLPHGSKLLQSNVDARLHLAGAAFDLNSISHWALSFRSSATEAIYVRCYDSVGELLSADLVDVPATGLGSSVGGGVAFNRNDNEFLVGYGIDDPGVSSQTRQARRVYPSLIPWSTSGTGCSPATLSWFGPQWIGSSTCGVQLSGVPVGALSVLMVATTTASLQLFGFGGIHDGCWLYVPLSGPDYLGMLGPSLAVNTQWPLPLPAAVDNQILRFQGVVFDPATGEFFSTHRLNVPIGK